MKSKLFNLDEDAIFILGRPNFWCGPIAHLMAADGHEVAKKAEDEQAAVIYFMLQMREDHGDTWKDEFFKEIDRMQERVKEKLSK